MFGGESAQRLDLRLSCNETDEQVSKSQASDNVNDESIWLRAAEQHGFVCQCRPIRACV